MVMVCGCVIKTATTSLHIQPCLQQIQHPAQFFIVFLQLLACYSATQTPWQSISRFQTHAVGLFASPRFQNRCISVHLFSRQGSLPILAMTHIISHYIQKLNHIEKMCRKEIQRISLEFSSRGCLLFTHIPLSRIVSKGWQRAPAASACCWSDCNCSAGTDSDTWNWKTPKFRAKSAELFSRKLWDSPHKMFIAFLLVK